MVFTFGWNAGSDRRIQDLGDTKAFEGNEMSHTVLIVIFRTGAASAESLAALRRARQVNVYCKQKGK